MRRGLRFSSPTKPPVSDTVAPAGVPPDCYLDGSTPEQERSYPRMPLQSSSRSALTAATAFLSETRGAGREKNESGSGALRRRNLPAASSRISSPSSSSSGKSGTILAIGRLRSRMTTSLPCCTSLRYLSKLFFSSESLTLRITLPSPCGFTATLITQYKPLTALLLMAALAIDARRPSSLAHSPYRMKLA